MKIIQMQMNQVSMTTSMQQGSRCNGLYVSLFCAQQRLFFTVQEEDGEDFASACEEPIV